MITPHIPVMNSNIDPLQRKDLLKKLKEAKASRLWIAFDRETLFTDRTDALALLKENLRYFEKAGIEAGVWFQAFGFGDPLKEPKNWVRIRSICGAEREGDAFCPEDPDFLKAYLDWVRDIAACKPSLMMLDDDLCLSVRPGIGCFCKRHMALLEEKCGKISDLTAIFKGGKNPYRDAYLEVMGESLKGFCRKVRRAVDEINPAIRVGLCAGYTSWDLEGTDPLELSRILAGNTAPFFRLTGAPYWVAPQKDRFKGQRLSAVIESARNQAAWCKESGIEFFAEADSFPRPCYHCPAMLIENFDLAMHAAGIESLKYLYDYHSSLDYERAYHKIHIRNLPLYEKIEEAFKGASPCGVRLYRPAHWLKDALLPQKFWGEKAIMRSFFSTAAAMLSAHSIPLCYDGESPFAAFFGEDARFFEDRHEKILLDLPAALRLQERGINLGIEKAEEMAPPLFEHFGKEKVLLARPAEIPFWRLTLGKGARVESTFDNGAPASFCYGKYLILAFEASAAAEGSTLFSSYARGEQLRAFFGHSFPAISHHSEIYCLCAEKEGRQIALIQNHSIDPLFDFEILLPKVGKGFTLHGAKGALCENKIKISGEFPPQGTLLLEVKYE